MSGFDRCTSDLYASGSTGPKWIRKCKVRVGTQGSGFVVDGLRVQFEVTKTIYRTPNVASVKIYNLTPDNAKTLQDEFTDIAIVAGYEKQEHLLFQGNIRFSYLYRDGNDWVSEIEAGDGDKDFANTKVSFTLAKDSTDAIAIEKIVGCMSSTEMGRVHGKNISKERIRGAVYCGNARDYLDKIARTNDAHWSIQDGKVVLIPVDSVLPGEAILISSETGLLGAPEVNDKGITITSMLDPRIVPNGKLWLMNNDVKLAHMPPLQTGQQRKLKGPKKTIRLDPDGVYKVFSVKHTGDTRGGSGSPWKSECRCVGLDQPIPKKSGVPLSSTPDGDVL